MGKEVPPDALNNMLGNVNCFIVFPSSFLLTYGLLMWQLIMFYLRARICLVQMSFLIRYFVSNLYICFGSVKCGTYNSLFFKVIFVELNREESQKYLDQMKQDLVSVSKDDTSTLPCGDSFKSFPLSTLQTQGSLAGLPYIIFLTCNATVYILY